MISPIPSMSDPAYRVLRLSLLDKNGTITNRGSGLLIHDLTCDLNRRGFYLYTCWHFVSGVDFLEPKVPKFPKKNCRLRIEGKKIESTGPGSSQHGWIHSAEIDLYDESGSPLWEQSKFSRSFPQLEEYGINVPKQLDAIRIRLDTPDEIVKTWAVPNQYISEEFPRIGDSLFISGYPYGYSSTGDDWLEPIFIKRHVASHPRSSNTSLLDGIGCPGMSGGPIFKKVGKEWFLIGMYRGFLYPRGEQDKLAAMGIYTMFYWLHSVLSTGEGYASDMVLDKLLAKPNI